MIDYNKKIAEFLYNQGVNVGKDSVISKDKFSEKQFEHVCVSYFEQMMKAFFSQGRFIVRLLDDDNINGLAFEDDGVKYSVIYWGTIRRIYEDALKLTENRDYFCDCFANANWRPISLEDISEESRRIETKYRRIYSCGTNDETRRGLADLIAQTAYFSVMFHEMGHILDGHLGFLKERYSVSILPAVDECINHCVENLIKNQSIKALEKDADEFAGNRIIEHTFKSFKQYYFNNYSDVLKEKDATLFKIVVSGITLVFLLCDNQYNSSTNYLPNAYRILTILNAGYANGKNNQLFELDKDEYEEILVTCIRDTIKAFNTSFSETQIDENDFITQLNSGEKVNFNLKNTWNQIRPILEKYKHQEIMLAPIFEQ